MSRQVKAAAARHGARALLLASVLAPGLAMAAPAAPAPSSNVTINLIRLLVKQKVITQAAADALLAEAEAEAARAAPPVVAAAPAQNTVVAALPPAAAGTIRVPYVPETVRNQIKDELKGEVLAQAKAEGWAAPSLVPEWVSRLTWNGDIRVRYQVDSFGKGNIPEFINFNEFNLRGPTDINAATNPAGFPLVNTRVNRADRFRIRLRFGLSGAISEGADFGIRLVTGDDNNPIAVNQFLGGGFSKKAIWLDQAYVALHPSDYATVTAGRIKNPFLATDLLYDYDLTFDGFAADFHTPEGMIDDVKASLVLGAFPLEFANENFPTNSIDKVGASSKWLFAAQARADWQVNDDILINGAVGYHYFYKARGELSAPCAVFNGNPDCSTDFTRPASLRKGNTLFLLRDILPDPANPLNFAQPQFVGLAQNFRLISGMAEVTAKFNDHLTGQLQAHYVRNIGYRAGDICRNGLKGLPVNNVTVSATGNTNPCAGPGNPNPAKFESGPNAFYVRGLAGYLHPSNPGEWQVELGYRYIQADALLDAYTDDNFGLGGTNSKGYILGANIAIFKNVTIGGRWLSTNEITGPSLGVDIFQLDLGASF